MFSFVPSFVAKTQNPAVQDKRFYEFMIPSPENSWAKIEGKCCSALSEQSSFTCSGLNSITLPVAISFFRKEKKEVCIKEHVFLFFFL